MINSTRINKTLKIIISLSHPVLRCTTVCQVTENNSKPSKEKEQLDPKVSCIGMQNKKCKEKGAIKEL